MSDENILVSANALLFKISVITGWQIPDNQLYADSLVAEFYEKIKEAYGQFTVAEILYAFRTYSKKIEDFGKMLNLQIVDRVMDIYERERRILSDQEEAARNPPIQRIFTQEENDNAFREDAQRAYRWFLANKSMPPYVETHAEILAKDGLIREGEFAEEYFIECAKKEMQNIYKMEKPNP